MANIFAELGGTRRLLYFGDLDPQGLLIPQEASARAQVLDLPAAEPHLWSYGHLFTPDTGRGQTWEFEPPSSSLCGWLGDFAEPARQLFTSGKRIDQEYIGWEFLQTKNNEISVIQSQ